MIKRLISLFVLFSICLCICTPAMAAENTPSNTFTYKTSATGKMEISVDTASPNTINSQHTAPFVITQYENNRIIQTVTGEIGGSQLVVTNFKDSIIVNRYTINVAERISKTSPQISTFSAPAGNVLGYITYKKDSVTGEEMKIRVSSVRTKNDTESYVINGKKTDTLSTISALLLSFLTFLVSKKDIVTQIAVAIITFFGGEVTGAMIGVAFSEPVAVNAYYYELTGYDASYDRCTQKYSGISRHVLTKSSSAYNDWIIEGCTHQNWQDSSLAYWFWTDLNASNYYPGVKSYS